MTIVSCILARNEADRDLPAVLENAATFADRILVLDDSSTDDTVAVSKRHGATVRTRKSDGMWGREAPARKELWDWGAKVAKDGWLLIQDADMLLRGDPRPLTKTWTYNAWSFVLYDLWGEGVYREGDFWQGHLHPRPWLFCPSRVPEGWVAEWPARGIHVGHAPLNYPLVSGVIQPEVLHWEHRAYVSPLRRQAKAMQYRSQSHQLTPFEAQHVDSILAFDPDVPAPR